jgi:hypothetical protein
MLQLGLVPVMNGHAMRQLLASSVMAGIEVGILGGLLGSHPRMILPIVFGIFLYRFAAMSRGSLFLFGANGVISLSIMLHFARYPSVDINHLIFNNFWATAASVIIAYAMTALWPDVEPLMAAVAKAPNRMRHEVLLGASIATASFIVFQVFNLRDSMSAQATTLLILFPMHWNGALGYARKRAIGILFGVTFGLLGQGLLYDGSGLLIFVIPLLWIGLMLFSQVHVREASGSGVGFGAMTTLGILFGQYLTQNNDLVFSALHRISSILVAIMAEGSPRI